MKPDITAPGLWVASSYNSFYLEGEIGERDKVYQARYSTFNGHRYPWGYMSGTSIGLSFRDRLYRSLATGEPLLIPG